MWGLGFGAEACGLQGLRFCGMGSDGAQAHTRHIFWTPSKGMEESDRSKFSNT